MNTWDLALFGWDESSHFYVDFPVSFQETDVKAIVERLLPEAITISQREWRFPWGLADVFPHLLPLLEKEGFPTRKMPQFPISIGSGFDLRPTKNPVLEAKIAELKRQQEIAMGFDWSEKSDPQTRVSEYLVKSDFESLNLFFNLIDFEVLSTEELRNWVEAVRPYKEHLPRFEAFETRVRELLNETPSP